MSEQRATTRDILTGVLRLKNCDCVLFDCAGLEAEPSNVLDELAQTSAVESLNSASVVLFCVDANKADYSEDIAALEFLKTDELVIAATKCDLVEPGELESRLSRIGGLFESAVIVTSSKTGEGLVQLKGFIDNTLTRLRAGSQESAEKIAITQRHRQVVAQAVVNLSEAESEITAGNDEVAAMLLRAAYGVLSGIEQESIDEAVLERIFSRFCIGK